MLCWPPSREKRAMSRLLLICLGGALGTGVRYVLSGFVLRLLGTGFPYGTLCVNVIGSFLLAAIMHVGLTTGLLSPTLRLVLGTGVMGGFTTYSTFNYETMQYLQDGALALASLNAAGTLLACLASGGLGLAFGRWLAGS
jgi:fluoride exporter